MGQRLANMNELSINYQILYFHPSNCHGAAMNMLSFGNLQFVRTNLVSNFSDLQKLSESVKNKEVPDFELAAKFTVDQLINSIRITTCLENFMKGLLLLNGCMIHRLRKKKFKNIAEDQHLKPVRIEEVLNGQTWNVNNELKTTDPNLKKQIDGILKTTIGMKELLKEDYQKMFKIESEILDICKPYFEYRNNLHLYMGEEFSITENSASETRKLVEFVNMHLVRIPNKIIESLEKGDEYKLKKIELGK